MAAPTGCRDASGAAAQTSCGETAKTGCVGWEHRNSKSSALRGLSNRQRSRRGQKERMKKHEENKKDDGYFNSSRADVDDGAGDGVCRNR